MAFASSKLKGIGYRASPLHLTAVCSLYFCTALFISAYSAKNPWLASLGSNLILEVLNPVHTLYSNTTRGVGAFWDSYISLMDAHDENLILKTRLKLLESQTAELLENQKELERLKAIFALAERHQLKGVTADIIGFDSSSWVQSIMIDKGSNQGVQAGQPVVDGKAVVGQVISASFNTAKVLLLTDHGSGIDGLIQSSRARGIVEGKGNAGARFSYVTDDQEVALGDRVVTSGLDGIFPKGLMLGIVSKVDKGSKGMLQQIEIEPAVNFERLETVLVVTGAQAG